MNLRNLAIIFTVALIIRTIYLFAFFGLEKILDCDSYEYDGYAMNLVEGKGYCYRDMRSFRPPGYPFFLASIHLIFGHSIPIVKIIQAIMSAFICVFTYIVGLKLYNKKIALISGFSSCVYFALFDQPSHILTETLFTFLLILAILFLLDIEKSILNEIISGILLGLATLTRPIIMLFLPFIGLWLAIKFRLATAMKKFFLLTVFFILPIIPWTIRNYLIHNAFVPVSVQAGYQFWAGHNPHSKGRWTATYLHNDMKKYAHLPEVERDIKYFQEGFKYLKSQNIFQLIKLYFLKAVSFFHPFLTESEREYDLTYGFVLPFWILGMYIAVKLRHQQMLLLLFLILSFFISTLVFYSEYRFRSPLSPFILIFSSLGIVTFYTNFKKKFYPILFTFVWGLCNILIYFNSKAVYSIIILVVNKIRSI